MKWFVVVLLFAMAAMPSKAMAQQHDYLVTVAGEATKMVVPDKVAVTLSIRAEDKKQVRAVELQGQKSQALMAALKSLGVTEKEVATTGYAYGPVSEYDQDKKKQVVRGYQAVQSLTVKTARENAAALVDAVSTVAEVGSVSFFVSNPKQLHEELVDLAIADALDRAKRRAAKLGLTLGPVVAYQESTPNSGPLPPRAMMRAAPPMEAADAPELPAGETEFKVNVSVTYKLVVK